MDIVACNQKFLTIGKLPENAKIKTKNAYFGTKLNYEQSLLYQKLATCWSGYF